MASIKSPSPPTTAELLAAALEALDKLAPSNVRNIGSECLKVLLPKFQSNPKYNKGRKINIEYKPDIDSTKYSFRIEIILTGTTDNHYILIYESKKTDSNILGICISIGTVVCGTSMNIGMNIASGKEVTTDEINNIVDYVLGLI